MQLALRYCSQSLEMDRSLHGEGTDHVDVAATLHSVGLLLNTTGEYRKGLQRLQESLAMKRRLYPRTRGGEEHPSVVATDEAIATVMLEAATLGGLAGASGSKSKAKIVDDERSTRCIIS